MSRDDGLYGVLGDVSGKGVPAALLSAMILGFLDARLRSEPRLHSAVELLNELLSEKGNGRYVTLFLFHLGSGGTGTFVSAGHNTAYVYRRERDAVEELPSNNTIVGMFPSVQFTSAILDLGLGDVMLVYSDGVTEAENAAGEMLGEDAVRGLLQSRASDGPEGVRASLIQLLERFTLNQQQRDDITFLAVQRVPPT